MRAHNSEEWNLDALIRYIKAQQADLTDRGVAAVVVLAFRLFYMMILYVNVSFIYVYIYLSIYVYMCLYIDICIYAFIYLRR